MTVHVISAVVIAGWSYEPKGRPGCAGWAAFLSGPKAAVCFGGGDIGKAANQIAEGDQPLGGGGEVRSRAADVAGEAMKNGAPLLRCDFRRVDHDSMMARDDDGGHSNKAAGFQ